jgi:hypothetical protein
MRAECLRYLCDLNTRQRLELTQGAVINSESGARYLIRDGIRIFLNDVVGSNRKYQAMYDRLAPGHEIAERLRKWSLRKSDHRLEYMHRGQIAFLIWSVLLLVPQSSYACSCVQPTPPVCQEAWRAAAVFLGTVVRTEVIADERQMPWAKVHLAVTEPFLGLTPETKEIDILTGTSGPACGFAFEKGRSYLVFADRTSDGMLRTSHCARTANIENAASDLAYLRSLPTLKPVGQIAGFTFNSQAPRPSDNAGWPWGILPDVQITIHSPQVQKNASSDSNGRFAFPNLPPGAYSVSASASGYWAGPAVEIVLPAKGCAEVQFNLNIDRAIVGRLLDQLGRPVPNVTVELVAQQFGLFQTTSDAQGHYEFRRLQAGEYYLGVSLSSQPLPDHPYEAWYYPGVSDFAKAISLPLDEHPKLLSVDLPLPAPQQEVTAAGIVQWPDGHPAANADVVPEDPNFPNQLGMIRLTTDENGKFQAKLFDKTTYKLYAAKYEGRKATSAQPVTIVPGQLKEGTIIKLILSYAGDLIYAEKNKR